ncbi:MAG: methyltransferase domain-containing protein [Bacteroidota bacterium]
MNNQNIYRHPLTEIGFNNLLPHALKQATQLYFTPVEVAQTAAEWLTENHEEKILDIGAGVGKFCVAAARVCNKQFYGVEYRETLVEIGNELIDHFEVSANASMIFSNITNINFLEYDAFYLFSPFYENLEPEQRLNDEVEIEEKLYQVYLDYTESQLAKAKMGTRLVTYFGNNFEVPDSYQRVRDAYDGSLKLWIKME